VILVSSCIIHIIYYDKQQDAYYPVSFAWILNSADSVSHCTGTWFLNVRVNLGGDDLKELEALFFSYQNKSGSFMLGFSIKVETYITSADVRYF
jgi:hypothetical protein